MTDYVRAFHMWETLLFAFLCTVPFMVLVLYSYRGHWRFGKKCTFLLVSVVFVLQMVFYQVRIYSDFLPGQIADIAKSIIYVMFIFIVLKEHVGKLTFTVLVLSNLGDFMVIAGKCLEGLFFPRQALIVYHFTYPLFMALVLAVELSVAYLLIFRNICTHGEAAEDGPAEKEQIGGYMWRYLWLVPAVFYLIGMQYFYSSSSDRSQLENLMDPLRTIYLLIVYAGSILIYRIIVKTAELYDKNMALLAENHTLSIQRLQYDSLNERLENMRRTKHDIRHHAALLKEIRDSGDITALDDLIAMYTEQNLLDQPLIRCENETVNVILALYSETAYEGGITFSVKADVPKDVFVDKKDLVVLFGNLLENAADACRAVTDNSSKNATDASKSMPDNSLANTTDASANSFIDLNATYSETPGGAHCLSLMVRNSCEKNISPNENGIFRSTKHPGDGIGISSVKNITEKYSGACSFMSNDGIFTVSVILYG